MTTKKQRPSSAPRAVDAEHEAPGEAPAENDATGSAEHDETGVGGDVTALHPAPSPAPPGPTPPGPPLALSGPPPASFETAQPTTTWTPHQHYPQGPTRGSDVVGVNLPVSTWLLLTQVLALGLILLGNSLPFDNTMLWSTSPLWAGFAAVAGLFQFLPAVGVASANRSQRWNLRVVVGAALVLFWVLIVLAEVSTNAGFCLTLGVFTALTAIWLSPDRQG